MTCIVPDKKRIIILETAADLPVYSKYRDSIINCAGSLLLE